ncbi:VWA domain-containing protein [Alicyclobacillus shizuokensis]|uniref:VWA domain-containing protein n=1 Tax=Alicyclobacillus shizuokensis TaxID=392014 RepID=UPI0012ECFE01|nr:VWA domain-containing protein [Alicyclobacillus shizuokensis]
MSAPVSALATSRGTPPSPKFAQLGAGSASRGEGGTVDSLPDRLPAWAERPLRTVGMPLQPSRRLWQTRPDSGVDWRRTVRLWARLGRMSLHVAPGRRFTRPGRVAVLWDVSGSMAEFIPLYAPWLYALARDLPQVGVFLFANRLVDATALFRQPYPQAKRGLDRLQQVWRGGTRLGEVLAEWVEDSGRRWLTPQTTVVVVSDGWDAGDPAVLARALRSVRRRGCRILWVHPWLGTPGFAPRTRALLAARPFIDRMVPGHSASALLRLTWDTGLRSGLTNDSDEEGMS